MKKQKIHGDAIIFKTLLKGCIQFKKFEQGLEVLEDAISDGIVVQSDIIETIIEGVSDKASTDMMKRVTNIREQVKRNWMGKSDKQGYTRKHVNQYTDRSSSNNFNQMHKYKGKSKWESNYTKNKNFSKRSNNKPNWNNSCDNNEPISKPIEIVDSNNQTSNYDEEEFKIETISPIKNINPLETKETKTSELATKNNASLKITKKVFYPSIKTEIPHPSSKLTTSSKIWIPNTEDKIEKSKQVEDKENNMNINNKETKTKSENVQFGKPKTYYNEKKNSVNQSQKKILGDSATLSKAKRDQDYEDAFY